MTGDLALDNNVIDLEVLGTPVPGLREYTVTLFEFFSADGGSTATPSGIASGLNLGSLGSRVSSAELVFNTNSIDLVYSVPEPASLTALLLGGLALLRRRRSGARS